MSGYAAIGQSGPCGAGTGLRDPQVAHCSGHGEYGAAHVHLLGGELRLVEEAAAKRPKSKIAKAAKKTVAPAAKKTLLRLRQ